MVDQVFKFFAGLEIGDLLRWNLDSRPRLGIAPYARAALPGTKAAKASNLNLVPRSQRAHHAVKDGFHNDFTIFARELGQTGYFFDQIGFGHSSPIPPEMHLRVKKLSSDFRDKSLTPFERHDDLQTSGNKADFHRRAAGRFAVSIKLEGRIGFNPHFGCLKVFHFLEPRVTAKVDDRKAEQHFRLADPADQADVQQSVVKHCPRSDLYAASIAMSVADGDQQRLSFLMAGISCHFNVNRTKRQQRLHRSKQVSDRASDPRWHAIRAGIGIGVHAGADDTAKRNLLGTVADETQIDLAYVFGSGTELLPGAKSDLFALDAQRVGEVIAGSLRDNQHRNFPGANLWQVAVNGPVTTEDEGRMG